MDWIYIFSASAVTFEVRPLYCTHIQVHIIELYAHGLSFLRLNNHTIAESIHYIIRAVTTNIGVEKGPKIRFTSLRVDTLLLQANRLAPNALSMAYLFLRLLVAIMRLS